MNTKIFAICFAFFFTIMVLTFASADLIVNEHPSSLTVYQNSNVTSYFVLMNNGDPVHDIVFSAENLPYGVSITFLNNNINLSTNESQVVNFTISANNGADLGQTPATIYANSHENISTSFTFDLDVKQNYCSNGPQGSKLRLTIDNPDNGDDFYAGDNISVDVNVKNTGSDSIDFVIETQLYDLTTQEEIDSASLGDSLDEGDENDYSLSLKVPNDVDQNDEYVINVKVYEDGNEDAQCKQDSVNIDIKKRAHELLIEEVDFGNPLLKPGDILTGNVQIANVGTHDEDNVILKITNSELGILYLSDIGHIDHGHIEDVDFDIDIPNNAKDGVYFLTVEVYNDNCDTADNSSSFIVDAIKPIAYFGLNPRDGLVTGSQRITFDVKCSDNHGLSKLKIYGSWNGWGVKAIQNNPINNSYYHITISNIPYGNWRWAVFCQDKAGNTAFTNTNRTLIIRPPLTPIYAIAS